MWFMLVGARPNALRASALLVLAGVAGCGRTDLDITGGLYGESDRSTDAGVTDTGVDDGAGTVDSAYAGGSDAPAAPCATQSLLPGSTIPEWSISVQPRAGSILEDVYAVMVAADGAIFAVGCGDLTGVGQGEFSNGDGACFLAKLDSNGRPFFVDRFVDDVNDPLSVGLVDDHEGGVVIGLRYDEETDLGGTWESAGCGVEHINGCGELLWAHPFPGLDCVSSFAFTGDKNGRSILAASCGSYCSGGSTVIRLDQQGTLVSQRILNGATLLAAAVQSDDTLLLGGYGGGQVDFGAGSRDLGQSSVFFATYDTQLSLENLLVSADGAGNEMEAAATADGTGFVVAGVLDQTGVNLGGGPLPYSGPGPAGGPNQDIFVARLTTHLGHVFSESFGDATSQDTTSICLDPDGAISWAGLAGVETSFGGLVVSGDATMGADGFLARFAPDGTPQAVTGTPDGVRQLACITNGYALAGYTGYPADLGAGVVPTGGYVVKRARP